MWGRVVAWPFTSVIHLGLTTVAIEVEDGAHFTGGETELRRG